MSDVIRYNREKKTPDNGQLIQIINRFGELSLDLSKALTIKGGLLGFPTAKEFCLLNYPNRDDMKLLQSVSDPELCFIVLPLRPENNIHAPEHIKAACTQEGFDMETTMLLLVVSARYENGKRTVSCNARAPVFYDCALNAAKQKPLTDGDYSLRAPL